MPRFWISKKEIGLFRYAVLCAAAREREIAGEENTWPDIREHVGGILDDKSRQGKVNSILYSLLIKLLHVEKRGERR